MTSRTRYAWVGILAAVLGGVTAWAVSTRTSAVQPLERLPGGIITGPTVETITDTSAMIALKTAAPALCQVNYGPTAQYGQMRRMSMSGPMTDHRILLPGLQPEATYHVRLTAVDPHGRIYQSSDFTLKTLPATSGRPQGQNVAASAAGARVTGVSSNYRGEGNASAYGANHAIDGDPATEWSSNGDGDRAWIEIELARTYHLTAVGFWTRTMGASAQIEQFAVVADGKTTLGPFTLRGAGGIDYFPVDVTARRLRFNVLRSNGGNTGAMEIEALASP